MDNHADPYHLIKSEIDNELQHMTSMLAKLFAGHGEVAAELTRRLQSAAEQLQALEAAVQSMVADPAKYGLTAGAAFGRKVSMTQAASNKPLQSCAALFWPCPCAAVHMKLQQEAVLYCQSYPSCPIAQWACCSLRYPN
jgi:hypothetical protein